MPTIPQGWDPNKITMGQVTSVSYASQASGVNNIYRVNGANYTVTDPIFSYEFAPISQGGLGLTSNPLNSYYTYFGSGNAALTQFSLLPLSDGQYNLTTGKITLPIVAAAEKLSNPVLVVYSSDWSNGNDVSTASGQTTVAQTIGEADPATITSQTIGGITTYTVTTNFTGVAHNAQGTNSAVMEFANLALQSAAFNHQAQLAGLPQGAATILFNPDGIATMANDLANNANSAVTNSSDSTNIAYSIYAGSNKYNNIQSPITIKGFLNGAATASDVNIAAGSSVVVNANNIDWFNIIKSAVSSIYSDKSYANTLGIPLQSDVLLHAENLQKTLTQAGIQNNIKAYLPWEAFIVNEFAPKCSVATNGSIWSATNSQTGPWSTNLINNTNWDVNAAALDLIDNYNALGWQYAQNFMDFIAFDRYEQDDLSAVVAARAGFTPYAYTPAGWANTLSTYVKATQGFTDPQGVTHKGLMADSNNGIMLWQIPSGSLPTVFTTNSQLLGMGVSVSDGKGGIQPAPLPQPNPSPDHNNFHSGIEQYYFFGQSGVGPTSQNWGILNNGAIAYNVAQTPLVGSQSPTYLDQLNSSGVNSGVIQYLNGANVLNQPNNPLLQQYGIFAIEWGGGNTSAPISYSSNQWVGSGSSFPSLPPVATPLFDSLKASQLGSPLTLRTALTNATTSDAAFVNLTYNEILHRSPEENGYNNWVGQLNGASLNRSDFLKLVCSSPEFSSKNPSNSAFVTEIYKDLLGRNPEASGQKYWTDALDHGLARVDLVGAVINSPEFVNASHSMVFLA